MNMHKSTLLVLPFIYAPHILYYIACKNPRQFSFTFFSAFAVILRFMAYVVVFIWFKHNILGSENPLQNLLPTTIIPGWLIGIPFIIFGQILNLSVYKTLGFKGVYYGKEFGVLPTNKYYTGFPFSVISQPQYTGATLTIIGAFLTWGIYANGMFNPYFFLLAFNGIALYSFSIIAETNCAAPKIDYTKLI